jgi:NADH-quinone oxidoreductase subunit J
LERSAISMTVSQIIFLLSGLLILGAAIMVVSTRNLIHAALWLVATLFGVAVLYALLEAAFLAVVQVVVYIGAIAIMFIFAVMLTRRDLRDTVAQHNPNWFWALLLAVLSAGGLLAVSSAFPVIGAAPARPGGDPLTALSAALVSPNAFVLPFEVASVLLLAALVGAVYVAMNKK